MVIIFLVLFQNSWVPRKDENLPTTISEIGQNGKLEQQSDPVFCCYPLVTPEGRAQKKALGVCVLPHF